MTEPRPVRLQLSRKKGFDLQALSLATNGLPAVNVARPGRWGNPFNFRPSSYCWLALSFGCRGDAAGRQEASVKAFREWIAPDKGQTVAMERGVVIKSGRKKIPIGPRFSVGEAPTREVISDALRGKNLACWCGPGEKCHADVLLELANTPVCEAIP